MADPYANIAKADPVLQEQIADVMERRAAEPKQIEMRETYLAKIAFSRDAQVLEVGCGTGPHCRRLASYPGVAKVIGLDPSPILLAKARELSQGIPNLSFREGDGRELPFEEHSFDIVLFHTTLCHIPGYEAAIAEAFRVLRSNGSLVVFDGDYTTATVALNPSDPLQDVVKVFFNKFVHNLYVCRTLPALVRSHGFKVVHFMSHGYLEVSNPGYMFSVIDRGADVMVDNGTLHTMKAEALKAEAQRRRDVGEFFGFIAYFSLIARKP
jgi:ubiquinone/menaquinone biosynthesis C-methylase UbiE